MNRFLRVLLLGQLALFCTPLSRAWGAMMVYPAPYPYYGPVYAEPVYEGPRGAALGPWKWNFNFGGGPAPVLGPAQNDIRNGWNVTIGGGYNFTPRVGLTLEYADNWMDVTDSAINQHQAFDGNSHLWSVTLNPVWRFPITGILGGYVIGGGGFYERVDKFFTPGVFNDPIFGPVPVTFEDRHVDDTGGLNIGAGLTFNFGWGTKFYIETRYHHLFTSGHGTDILPITFGFRW